VSGSPTLTLDPSFLDRLRASGVQPDLLSDILQLIRATKVRAKPKAVAVVGMSCRAPPDIATPAAMWEALAAGQSGMIDFPDSRWRIDDYYSADPQEAGRVYVKSGGFLAEVDELDCSFFGLAPAEALHIDPQHRLLLEVAWEAIENGGLSLAALQRAQTGVFVGIGSDDYAHLSFDNRRLEDISVYSGTGNSRAVAAGRISFLLGFTGPSLAIDTACSSSLASVHQAVHSLQANECDYALAGGVNLVLSPHNIVARCRLGTLSPKAQCRSFDDGADGFALGEACGMVVLRRLEDAVRDKDIIHAVVLASAANHNGGGGNGLTAPNGVAQEKLLRACLQRAGLSAADVDYLEAHGPGTKLGDTIEYDAVAAVYGEGRVAERPLYVGSAKANFGHSEAASGVIALLKAILVVKHRQAPPQIHFEDPSREIAWSDMMVVPTHLTDLAADKPLVRAAVSSFGIGGSNCHLLLETAPPEPAREVAPTPPAGSCILLSAADEGGLARQAERLAGFLRESDLPLDDIAFTLARRGRVHRHRLAIVSRDKDKAAKLLAEYAGGRKRLDVFKGIASRSPRVAFAFTGHGAQYPGMGRPFYERYVAFRDAIDQCDAIYRSLYGQSLRDLMFDSASAELDTATVSHPAVFAYQAATLALFRGWGVTPAAVIGHSVGEYGAAYAAGVLTLEEAMTLLTRRARLIDSLDLEGGMLALMAPVEQVERAMAAVGGDLDLAAVNGPEAVVVSGARSDLAQLKAWAEREGVGSDLLAVPHASHSSHMDPILDRLHAAAVEVQAQVPAIPMVSNVSGELLAAAPTADYWTRHARQTVQFDRGLRTLAEQGHDFVLELGPKPVLSPLVRAALPEVSAVAVGQPQFELLALQRVVAELFCRGHALEWSQVYADLPVQRIEAPLYAFRRTAQRKTRMPDQPQARENTTTVPARPDPDDLVTRILTCCVAAYRLPTQGMTAETPLPSPSESPAGLIALKNRLNADLGLDLTTAELWHAAVSPRVLHDFILNRLT
jgi:acyl transferase domain-containing protein